ncbi:hypothetical protein MBLNU457_7345t1 [Dothideomycetes sp. NU457]
MCPACTNAGAPGPLPMSLGFQPIPPPPPYRRSPDYMCYPFGGVYGDAMTMTIPPLPIISAKPKIEEKKDEKKTEKAPEKKKEKKDKKKKSDSNNKPGSKILLPKKMCYIHVIKDTMVWKLDKATDFKFEVNKVALSLTVADVIDVVSGKEGEEVKVWCLTEVVEVGDGKWSRGRVVEYADGTKVTLEGFGCSARNGEDLPPKWVVVHKKE